MFSSGIAAGQAFFILVSAALLTVPISLLLLWLYGRAVRREMLAASQSAGNWAVPSQSQSPHSGVPLLKVETLDAAAEMPSDAYRRAQRSLRSAIWVYALAGLAYALVFAAAWSYQADGALFAWRRITLLAGIQYWPAVIAIVIIAATNRVARAKIYLSLFVFLIAFSIYELAISPDLTVAQLLKLWLVTNGPPSLLIVALLWRPVRSIAPLVMSFLLVIITGGIVIGGLLLTPDQGRKAFEVGSSLGLGPAGIFFGAHIVGLFLFAIPGWWLLRRIGNTYRRKHTSDQSIMLDSLFFIFAFEQTLVLSARDNTLFIMAGALAFVVYKLVKWIGFRLLRHDPSETGPVLLLLRVFALKGRSERLFDPLTKWWRRAGSLVMIAGPDLIRSTIQPHELLEFVGGKIARQFVASEPQLSQSMATLDLRSDPDGRFRINQFFCHRDSWQTTMRELARHSSIVLMDLRSFSPQNQGCIYELGQLLNSVDLRRIVFLVDPTTDRAFLENTLADLWRRVAPDSPNLQATTPTVQLYTGAVDSASGFRHLVQRLVSPASSAAFSGV